MDIQADHIIEEAMQISLEELKAVSARILEEIEDREWDRVLSSPEGLADGVNENSPRQRKQ